MTAATEPIMSKARFQGDQLAMQKEQLTELTESLDKTFDLVHKLGKFIKVIAEKLEVEDPNDDFAIFSASIEEKDSDEPASPPAPAPAPPAVPLETPKIVTRPALQPSYKKESNKKPYHLPTGKHDMYASGNDDTDY